MRLHAKAFPSSSYMFASAANGGFCIDWTVLKAELSMKLTMHPLVQVADIFRPGRMTVCLTSAAASSAHLRHASSQGLHRPGLLRAEAARWCDSCCAQPAAAQAGQRAD